MDKKLIPFTKLQSKGTSMLRFIPLLAVFILLFITPAKAVEINDEGAERLKTVFSTYIDHLAKTNGTIDNAEDKETPPTDKQEAKTTKTNGSRIEVDGEILVEQADTYYAITLPPFIIHDEKGNKTNIGIIAINATPMENPDDWKLSIALPTSITHLNKDDKLLARLNIGSQRMGGLWNGKINKPTKISARYNDLEFISYKDNKVLSIQQFDLINNLKKEKDNLWSSSDKYKLSNIHLGNIGSPDMVSIKEIIAAISIENFLILSNGTLASILKNTGTNPLLSFLENNKNIASLKAIIKDVQINIPSTRKKKSQQISFKTGTFSFHQEFSKDALANISQQFGYRDLSTTMGRESSLIPENFNIKYSLNKIPLLEIINSAHKIITAKSKNSSASQVASLQAMMELPQILSKAGATFTLTDTYAENKNYNVNFNGLLQATPESPLKATGNLTVNATGLPHIMDTLKQSEKTASPRTQKRTEGALAVLQFLDSISKTEEGKNICKFNLDEQGKATVNGQDISAIMSLL